MCHVLIAEDEPEIRVLLEQTLKGAPFSYDLVDGGLAALNCYRQTWPQDSNFDLLVLDIEMPGLSGLDVARAVRADGSNIPIAFFTASLALENTEALLIHPVGFWLKPEAIIGLGALIERALDGHRSRIED